MTREATKTCAGAKVLIARGPGGSGATPITGPGDYAGWEEAPYLVPLIIEERLAPAWHRAKILLDMTKVEGAPRPVWDWRRQVSVDDRVQIRARSDLDAKVLFTGFVADVDLSATHADEACMVTAVSGAYRLARDVVVAGRWMYPREPRVKACFYNGLKTAFNAGGLPNMHPEKCTTLPHAPSGGIPIFTFDGDVGAEFWTLGDCLDYLRWLYNAEETWIENGIKPQGLHGDAYDEAFRLTLDATGLSAWAAMAAACDLAGWDLYEDAEAGSAGRGVITAVERGRGDAAWCRRQGVPAGEDRPELDFRNTNTFVAALAETTTAAVTRPIVAGGSDLYQITIPLQPAWDPARMALLTDEDPRYPEATTQYAQRYCRAGAEFPVYADVGRLWDANTDGRYEPKPWELTVPYVAGLCDRGVEESWPRMPYRPAPMLTTESPEIIDPETHKRTHKPPSQERIVEYSCDGGTTWFMMQDYSVDPERLAVTLSAENLGDISSGLGDDLSEPQDFFSALWADHENATHLVRLRLTCTIEAPTRSIYQPILRSRAGTGFETAEWFDRGQLGQKRKVATSSVWGTSSGDTWSDEADGWADLESHGLAIQGAGDRRRIEGSLAWEWLEGAPELTDVVNKIVGVDYGLLEGADADGSAAYPRVVARTLDLRNWSVMLSIGSERKAGTRFAPTYIAGAGGPA